MGLMRRLAAASPVLIVIEDVHWADTATRETIAFLVRSLRTERVVIAMTLRSDELHRRHPALPWLAELERTGHIERIDLHDSMSTRPPRCSKRSRASPSIPRRLARIHRRSDGNPFFIEELLLAEAEPAAGGLPSTLREILLARRHRARGRPPRAGGGRRRGTPDRPRPARRDRRCRQQPRRLEAALRAAIASQILVVDTAPQGAEGYAFRHALLAEVAYDELLPGERRRLHRECALALEAHPRRGRLEGRAPGRARPPLGGGARRRAGVRGVAGRGRGCGRGVRVRDRDAPVRAGARPVAGRPDPVASQAAIAQSCSGAPRRPPTSPASRIERSRSNARRTP